MSGCGECDEGLERAALLELPQAAELDTPTTILLKMHLSRDDRHMAGNNAGKRRNRLPAGTVAWKSLVTLEPSTGSAIDTAAQLSGGLAPSLYFELLLGQIAERDENGNVILPVLNPDQDRRSTSPAAA